MRCFTYYFLNLTVSLGVFGQFGPGGIGNTTDNALWLKADAGTIGNTNTSPISDWFDQSGNGNNVWQTNPNQQPLFIENFMNGYPSILFDNNGTGGQNDFFEGASNSTLDNTNGLSIFTVTRRNNLGNARSIVAKRVNVGVDQSYMFFYWTNDFLNTDIVSNNDRFTTGPIAFNANTNRILNMRYDGTLPTALRASMFEEENLLVTSGETSAFIPAFNSPLVVGATHVGDNRAFGGYISEIIIYRKAVNIAERIIVNNYLSAKYDIPISANDVYTMDNPANGNYDHEVAGIGRINASNQSTDGQGSGLVRILNANDLDDDEFLMWGHDNGVAQGIEFIDVPPTIFARFDRVWRASELNSSGSTVDVGSIEVRFDLNGLGAVNPSHLRLLVDENNNGIFSDDTPIAGAADLGGGIYAFTGITQIEHGYRFTIATTNPLTPLPVELKKWNIRCDEGQIKATWVTASETNNNYFVVEKSRDGKDWIEASKIDGAGNSSHEIRYDYTEPASSQLMYYRLKQIDFDGTEKIYPIKSVDCSISDLDKIKVYPVPASSELIIESPIQMVTANLIDMNGKTLKTLSLNELYTTIDVSSLANGVYLVELVTSYDRQSKRIVIHH
jgi:hypothetical protein